MGQLETGRWSKEYCFEGWRVMRLGSYNTIGTELLATSDMFLQNDGSHNLDMKPSWFEPSLKSEPSLDLTSRLSVAQQEGKAAVDLYRIWWEKYDKMTKGDKNVEEGWGRIKDEGSEISTMSSTLFVYFAAILFTFSVLMLMTVLICKKWRRRRASKLSTSTVSLPPPYEMVVEEKERLALAAGLPSYKEACPDRLDSLDSLDSLGQDSNSLCLDSSESGRQGILPPLSPPASTD